MLHNPDGGKHLSHVVTMNCNGFAMQCLASQLLQVRLPLHHSLRLHCRYLSGYHEKYPDGYDSGAIGENRADIADIADTKVWSLSKAASQNCSNAW